MKPKLAAAVDDVLHSELALAAEHRRVAAVHSAEHDVFHICRTLARQCDDHVARLGQFATVRTPPPASSPAAPSNTLLADLRHSYVAAADCHVAWIIVGQGAKAARDTTLVELSTLCCDEIDGQLRWIRTRIKNAAPQALTVG